MIKTLWHTPSVGFHSVKFFVLFFFLIPKDHTFSFHKLALPDVTVSHS